MSQRPSAPPGGGQERPDDQWPDDQWPDDLWPDDAGPAAGRPVSRGAGGKPPRRARPAVLAAVALAAAAIGAAVVLAVQSLAGSAPSGAAPASAPSSLPPGQPAGGGQPGGNGGAPGGAGVNVFLLGRVTAVTSTSITISGPGHTQTAAVTRATKITGKVSGIGGIKVGDQVSAQLTRQGGTMTAVAIADPAQPPAGGGLP